MSDGACRSPTQCLIAVLQTLETDSNPLQRRYLRIHDQAYLVKAMLHVHNAADLPRRKCRGT